MAIVITNTTANTKNKTHEYSIHIGEAYICKFNHEIKGDPDGFARLFEDAARAIREKIINEERAN